MSKKTNTNVPLDLQPERVKILDGYDESVAHLLGETETVLSAAVDGITKTYDARAAAKRNPTWNEAQQIIHTFNLAERIEKKLIKSFFNARATLENGANNVEKELEAPVTAKAAHPVASEIRAHAKGLPTRDRMKLIRGAIIDGDDATATAILGAPAYLSGLDDKMLGALTREWHERMNPDGARRVRVMRAGEDMLRQLMPTVQRALEKAVGAPPAQVTALREAKTAAEKHFVMQKS